MQVEITYDQGKLAFVAPIQLRREHLRLIVEIPGEDIVNYPAALETLPATYQLQPEVVAMAKTMEEKLDYVRNAPFPADENLPPLTQKQQERIAAFALRNEVRGLR